MDRGDHENWSIWECLNDGSKKIRKSCYFMAKPETGQNLSGKNFSMKVAEFNTEFADTLIFQIFWAYRKIWNNWLIRITTIPLYRPRKNKFARSKTHCSMKDLLTINFEFLKSFQFLTKICIIKIKKYVDFRDLYIATGGGAWITKAIQASPM